MNYMSRPVILAVPLDKTGSGDSRRVQFLQNAGVSVALPPGLYVERSACTPDVSKQLTTTRRGKQGYHLDIF